MSRFFIILYNYFKYRRWQLALAVIFVSAGLALIAGRLSLVENITQMQVHDPKARHVQELLQHAQILERIVVLISDPDTLQAPDKDRLVACADSFELLFRQHADTSLFRDIQNQLSDRTINELLAFVGKNVPYYLDAGDYERLERVTSRQGLDSLLAINKRNLGAVTGFFLKQQIIRDPLGMSASGLQKWQGVLSTDAYTLYESHLFSKDERNLLLFISPSQPIAETELNTRLVESLEKTTAVLNTSSFNNLEIRYLGAAPIAVANARQIKRDVLLTVGVSLMLLVVFISLHFRNVYIVFVLLLPVVLSGLVALAAISLFKTQVSAISLGMGSVLLGITLDFSLHIVTHHRAESSIATLLKDLSWPMCLSGFTTALAFFFMGFMQSQALRDMGLFGGLCILSACVISLLLVPHFLIKKANPAAQSTKPGFVDYLSNLQPERSRYVRWGIVSMSLLCLYYVGDVAFEKDLGQLNYMPKAYQETEKRLDEINQYKLKNLYLVSSAHSLDEALMLQEEANPLVNQLLDREDIKQALGVQGLLLSSKAQAQKIQQWNAFWTTQRKAQLRADIESLAPKHGFSLWAFEGLYATLAEEFPPLGPQELPSELQQVIRSYITISDSAVQVIRLLRSPAAAIENARLQLPERSELFSFDKQYIINSFGAAVQEDFQNLANLSFALVFVVLLLAYRSFTLSFISVIPLVLSWIWTLGILAMLGIKLTVFSIIISTFIFGMGDDYCIFLLTSLQQAHTYGKNNIGSYKHSILLSVATMFAGVGALVFARHPALQSIALIALLGIVSVMVLAFVVQPYLFQKWVTDRKSRGAQPITLSSFLITIVSYTLTVVLYIITVCCLAFAQLIPGRDRKVRSVHYIVWLFAIGALYCGLDLRKRLLHSKDVSGNKPLVIVSNHQSFLDILAILAIHPRIVLLTKSWVQRFHIFRPFVWAGKFYSVEDGYERLLERLRADVARGYSVAVFPEGKRISNLPIQRFHHGAFWLASELRLPVLPILIDGTGRIAGGQDIILSPGTVLRQPLPIQAYENGISYQTLTKKIQKLLRDAQEELRSHQAQDGSLLRILQTNYRFKEPAIAARLHKDWRQCDGYKQVLAFLPKAGRLAILGSGEGFLAYCAILHAPGRSIVGIEPDELQAQVARYCYLKNDLLQFANTPFDTILHLDASNILLQNIEPRLGNVEYTSYFKNLVARNPDTQTWVGLEAIPSTDFLEKTEQMALKLGLHFQKFHCKGGAEGFIATYSDPQMVSVDRT